MNDLKNEKEVENFNKIIDEENEGIILDFNLNFTDHVLDLFIRETKTLDKNRFKKLETSHDLDKEKVSKKIEEAKVNTKFINLLDGILKDIDIINNLNNGSKIPENSKVSIKGVCDTFTKIFTDAKELNSYIFIENDDITKEILDLKLLFGKVKTNLIQSSNEKFFACCSNKSNKEKLPMIIQKIKNLEKYLKLIFELKPRMKTEIIQKSKLIIPPDIKFDLEKLKDNLENYMLDNLPKLKTKVKLIKKNEKVIVNKIITEEKNTYFQTATEYFYGLGKEVDYSKAYDLFKKSVNSEENICAYNYLGKIYTKGLGVKKDYDKGIKQYKISAENNNEIGLYEMGKYNNNLSSKTNNLKVSLEFYKKSAELNYSKGLTSWAFFQENGFGCKKDINQAIENYTTAIKLNNRKAMNNLAILYLKMNNNHGQENQKKVYDLIKKSYDMGYKKSIVNLGICYFKGIYVKKDVSKAKKLFKQSSEYNNSKALYYLAYFKIRKALKGDSDSDKKFKKAYSLLNDSISMDPNNDEALFYLGFIYENGFGQESNIHLACELYRKSVELSGYQNSKALYHLALMHYNNILVKDKDIILDLVRKSADLNDSDALNLMGVFYQEGDMIKKDIDKAKYFFKESSKLANLDAKFNLFTLLSNNKHLISDEDLDNIMKDLLNKQHIGIMKYIESNKIILKDLDSNLNTIVK